MLRPAVPARLKGYERGSDIYRDLLAELIEAGQLTDSGVEYDPYSGPRNRADVVALVREGVAVQKLSAGDKADMITAVTPFYVEAGGEISDTGVIDFPETGARFRVDNVAMPIPGLVIHIGEVVRMGLKWEKRRGCWWITAVAPIFAVIIPPPIFYIGNCGRI
ncbi:MAG: alanine--tRNA ligase-related protein [Chloroflexi bacterium]|nr:alanine--tRNA ligase-related protein [Chloroflexota bacterium]